MGINPGLRSVAVQAHFAPRGNRFYPALCEAGIIDHVIDASDGFAAADVAHLQSRGIGITCLVERASAKASELSAAELRDGGSELRAKVLALRPSVVAFLGITAYRTAFDLPHAGVGRQIGDEHPGTSAGDGENGWGGAEVWVVPNPSGLNRHYSVHGLAAAYREVGVRAGIV